MSAHPPRFLVSEGARPEPGATVELDAGEARHARVRRLEIGESVVVFDGAGWSALAEVEAANRQRVALRVVRELPARDGESPLDLTLCVALLKTDRFEWMVEKAAELGVRSIVPFVSEHSLGGPSPGRIARWNEIAKSAVKQCGRTVFPRLGASVSFEEALGSPGPALLFAEREPRRTLDEAWRRIGDTTTLTVIVGPEGGFADSEIEKAEAAGAISVGLGPRILRAETAAVAAVVACQLRWGDLARSPVTT